jgi:pimeloyl-ACP methyl ester carboxylesterase
VVPFVDINSGRVAYDEAGSGPAVVLSHSSIADRRLWDHQFAALSNGYRVIRYDRLGFGESSDVVGEVDHASDLLAVLDALDVDRAALVGSSMGGAISVDVALAAPERVTALALICSGLSGWKWPDEMREQTRPLLLAAVPPERLAAYSAYTAETVLDDDIAAMAEMQIRFLAVGPGRTPDVLAPDAWQLALTMARRVFEREWRGVAHIEREPQLPPADRLGEITVPTLLVVGRADSPYLQAPSEVLAAGISAARRVDLPDAAHLPPIECPERISEELRVFLGAVTR